MNTSTFDCLGSPAQKRPRAEVKLPSEPAGPEGAPGHLEADQAAPEFTFRAKKLKPFTALNGGEVDAVGATVARRHVCCNNAIATTAVTHPPDNCELLNNGDSGFQEFMATPDDSPRTSLDVNDNTTVVCGSGVLATSLVPELIMPEGQIGRTGGTNGNEEQVEDEEEDAEVFDDDDSISELSCASDISSISGAGWKPVSNSIKWVQMQMEKGTSAKEIVRQLTGEEVPEEVDDMDALRFILRIVSESTHYRAKLTHINTIDDAISLIQRSSKIIVLTGAGVSVSCGIPDFRSRNGIYARLSKDYPDLPDPQSMFDIHYFKRNPYPFFKFAKEIYPGQFFPSPSHKFIRCIEQKGKLLRNYSQNIDTLEQAAGIERLITCHGSFSTASCTNCGYKVDSNAIKADIFAQRIPLCPKCSNENTTDCSIMSVMKPDIVFFGEGLSDEFHNSMTIDKDECDLLIVIGSSLKVRPVALIPNSIPETVPQILINREPLSHLNFDIELLGDCDNIIKHLCERLGPDWTKFCFTQTEQQQQQVCQAAISNEVAMQPLDDSSYTFVAPNRYIFKGAEISGLCLDDDHDDDDQSDQVDEDSNCEQNNEPSEESVSQSSTFAADSVEISKSDEDVPLKVKDIINHTGFFRQLEDPVNGENGHSKLSPPTHSTPEPIHPSSEKKEKRESIENYSPNSY